MDEMPRRLAGFRERHGDTFEPGGERPTPPPSCLGTTAE
jgi:hypothetical protein